ncbi:MAG: YceD family protein [Acidimicrobiia bacterium]
MAQPTSPFVVNVSDLVARPGSQRRLHVSAPADFGVELSRLAPGRRVEAELLFESLLEGVLVTGEVGFVLRHTCNRCLREWEDLGLVPVVQLYGPEPDEDGYRLEPGDLIDLEQLFRDEITLSFPLAPVCRPECRGLCPSCGIDLNEAPSHQHEEEPDSPFAVLGQLFEHEEK